MAKPKKEKKGTPPPIDKLLIPAIGIAAAMMAYQFYRGMSTGVSIKSLPMYALTVATPSHDVSSFLYAWILKISRVNVLDELELREVLFGEGESKRNFAVLCQGEDTSRVSSVFADAFKDGSSTAQFRLIDCNYVLPSSGKSIADRFKLDTSIRPTVFMSGAALGEPLQIPSKHLRTGAMLVKALKSRLEVKTAKIETTQDLRSKCLERDLCGLLLKGTKKAPAYLKDAMGKLLKEFPQVSFASVDTSVLYVKNFEDLLPELKDEKPRFAVFKKVSGSTKSGGSRLITSFATLDDDVDVSYGTLSNLLAGVVQKSITPKKVPSLPQIKTRTKKLVAEEKAKRERKIDQEQRKLDKESGRNTGSTENDGSREGRRAERERRRAEHRKKNNARERTPEEIAEMERRRRERMEEEAQKWNMAPEDMPDLGDLSIEDEFFDEEGYEEEDIITHEGEDDHGHDHEVIDLD